MTGGIDVKLSRRGRYESYGCIVQTDTHSNPTFVTDWVDRDGRFDGTVVFRVSYMKELRP